MNTYSEHQEWQDFAPEMQEELARIKADQAQIFETRNRIMNGGASKEQVFMAINAAATNMTIFRELYERSIRITVKFRQIQRRQDALEEKVERLTKKKTPLPQMTKAVSAASVIDFTARKRRTILTLQGEKTL